MEIQEKENQEVKRRFQLWVMPSTLELADQYYHSDNCASKSEFIEKAVLFIAATSPATRARTISPASSPPP